MINDEERCAMGLLFAKTEKTNEPFFALNNIRERLEMMCKGKLKIEAREGGGTSVKVTIPVIA